MDILARVFFEMCARDSDLPRGIADGNLEPAFADNRNLELANLIGFGQVGVEIVLARENRILIHGRVDCLREAHGFAHRLAVEHRQRAGQPEAGGADMAIGRIAEACGAGAENLGFGVELNMDFKPDNGLKRGHCCSFVVGFCPQ